MEFKIMELDPYIINYELTGIISRPSGDIFCSK